MATAFAGIIFSNFNFEYKQSGNLHFGMKIGGKHFSAVSTTKLTGERYPEVSPFSRVKESKVVPTTQLKSFHDGICNR